MNMNKYLCMYKWHHDHRFVPEHSEININQNGFLT